MGFGTKESLITLIRKSILLNELTTNLKVDTYDEFSHVFFTKNLLTSISIWNIINPIQMVLPEISEVPIKFYDSSSAFALTRNLFESYTNMHYLLVDNKSQEEKEFKFLLWNRHWREERRKITDSRGIYHTKLDKEEQDILEIEKKISTNNFYNALADNQKEYFKKRKNWATLNLIERAKRTTINEDKAFYMYKFLSNYAHSESFAIMQYNSINSVRDARKLLEGVPVIYTEGLLALTIDIFRSHFKKANEFIEKDDFLKQNIIWWKDYMNKKK